MSIISDVLDKHEAELLEDWVREVSRGTRKGDQRELREHCQGLLSALRKATRDDGDANSATYQPVRDLLSDFSRSRAQQGFSPTETAAFVFSFKKPLFDVLRKDLQKDGAKLAEQTWVANELLDRLGLYTTEISLKSREEVIRRQQQDMLELSTPVVKLWEGILALPLIGTLDSARTQVVMESMLQKIVETGSMVAIIDITGVPTVDTLVAQHLLKTVTAARLMGADCIISGIRPQIAQTIVHLGVTLGDVTTKATLADAFLVALQRTGYSISRKTQKSGVDQGSAAPREPSSFRGDNK
jgi:rsbT co-antagonist protein RsbR